MAQYDPERDDKVFRFLVPHLTRSVQPLVDGVVKFSHYTSAESAFSILESNSIWMRNSSYMNDRSELQFSINVLESALHSDSSKNFIKACDKIHENLSKYVLEVFKNKITYLVNNTYITCFSEHNIADDFLGRLSMWRAYGRSASIALVFDNPLIFLRRARGYVWFLPVMYTDIDGINLQLNTITNNIIKNIDFFQEIDIKYLLEYFTYSFMFMACSYKHRGFSDETEWRAVHSPLIRRAHPDALIASNIVINGIPQNIYKIPFGYNKKFDLENPYKHQLLYRIIVGPTDYSSELRKTFVGLLQERGMDNADERVVCSDIPLRV